jgi:hypothetical protein
MQQNEGTVLNPGDPGYEEARAELLKEAQAKERELAKAAKTAKAKK